MELLSGFGKRGVELNLLEKKSDIEDVDFLSKYFVLQEFPSKLTAGKNSITFNGSSFLKKGSEVLVECVDSSGYSLYIESTTKSTSAYKESSAYVLSIHVYSESSNGLGKLILYGTIETGQTVKWVGNVLIDKTQQNISTVRFYKKPILGVLPVLTPVLAHVGDLNRTVELSGSFYSYAVKPEKDNFKSNQKNIDVDYRIFANKIPKISDPTASFNNQFLGNKMEFRVKTIQEPYSGRNIETNFTTSVDIKSVINNSTLIISDVISYKDSKNNDVIVNVVNGDFYIKYPYVMYNTASESSSYLRSNTSVDKVLVKQSYADVTYENLRTFSGYIARHKLYKKSLFAPGDFEIISDEPLSSYELLKDGLTTNKSFDKMGSFYNQRHVDKYWFTSSNVIQLNQSSDRLNESLNIVLSPNHTCNDLSSSNNYLIVKDNTIDSDRNPSYYEFNLFEDSILSGSSYDSNFITLKKNVTYNLSLNAVLMKDSSTLFDTNAGLEFYFTSSIPELNLERNIMSSQPGLLKIGTLPFYESISEKIYNPTNIIFELSNDLHGTLVIVPKKCTATISELSLKPYGDFGFSPDVLVTRLPFPVTIKNEAFELKSELFDINSNIVYSDLRTIATFDPSGSSLAVFIPEFRDINNLDFVSGSLEISKSLLIGGDGRISGSLLVKGAVIFEDISESKYELERNLAWDPITNKISFTNLNDVDHSGRDELVVTLYEKGTADKIPKFRLIPSVLGKNIWVPKMTVPLTSSMSSSASSI